MTCVQTSDAKQPVVQMQPEEPATDGYFNAVGYQTIKLVIVIQLIQSFSPVNYEISRRRNRQRNNMI